MLSKTELILDSHADDALPVQSGISSAAPYRWVILGLAFTAFLMSFLDRLAWANAGLLASKSLGVPLAALGIFVTAFYCGYVLANFIGGFLTDRFGPRRILAFALLPLGISTFLFGTTASLTMGLVIQVLMGLCAGADYAACVKIIASWFQPLERGRAFGLFATAPSIGVVLANAIFPHLLHIMSWETLYGALGTITIAIALLCFLGLRNTPVRTPSIVPDRAQLAIIWRNRQLRIIALAGFGANWGTWGFTFWATALMVRGYKIPPVTAGLVTVIFGIAAVISKPLYGLLSDILGGRRRTLVIADLAAFVVMLILFGLMNSATEFLIIAPFLGITAFVYSPLMAAMLTETVERSVTGTAVGVINALWQLGSVIVPSVVGMVFAATHSFLAAFLTLAAGPLFGMIVMIADRSLPTQITQEP